MRSELNIECIVQSESWAFDPGRRTHSWPLSAIMRRMDEYPCGGHTASHVVLQVLGEAPKWQPNMTSIHVIAVPLSHACNANQLGIKETCELSLERTETTQQHMGTPTTRVQQTMFEEPPLGTPAFPLYPDYIRSRSTYMYK